MAAQDQSAAVPASAALAADKRRRKAGKTCKARSLACRECRDRKIRCDGARPVCDACSRRGWGAEQCVYPEIEHEGSIASSRSYILALQKRVKELEEKEQQMTNVLHQQHSASGTPPAAYDDAWPRPLHSPHAAAPPQPILPPIVTEPKYQIPGVFPMPHDNNSPLPLPHHQQQQHHQQHQHHHSASPPLTDDLEDPSPASAPAPAQACFGSYSTNAQAAALLDKMSLPPTGAMDELLGAYFDCDWVVMPVVHRPSFLRRYQHLVAVSSSRYRRDIPLAEATDMAVTYTLLLGMLAIGQMCRHTGSDAAFPSAAVEFHQQARSLLLADVAFTPSPLVVQAMLLHARFLRRSGAQQESWALVGMAHRLAEGLMLHVDAPGQTQMEREERRRTWCACVQLLRSRSAANGASASSSAVFGALPDEVDDEYLEARVPGVEGRQPPEVPSVLAFFVHSLRLSDGVLQPIKAYFQAPSSDVKTDDVFTVLGKTLKLDDQLQGWYDGTPRHLVLGNAASQGAGVVAASYRRQAVLMHLMHLETKTLLYRLAMMQVVKQCSKASLSSLARALAERIVEGCYAASMELVDVMAAEAECIVQCGVVPSHVTMVLCAICTSLSLLLRTTQLSSLSTKRAMLAHDTQRCLALAKQLCPHRDASTEKSLQVMDDLVQDRPRATLSPLSDVLDSAMEPDSPSSGLPPFKGLMVADTMDQRCRDGRAEMALLEAWQLGDTRGLAGQGIVMQELVALW